MMPIDWPSGTQAIGRLPAAAARIGLRAQLRASRRPLRPSARDNRAMSAPSADWPASGSALGEEGRDGHRRHRRGGDRHRDGGGQDETRSGNRNDIGGTPGWNAADYRRWSCHPAEPSRPYPDPRQAPSGVGAPNGPLGTARLGDRRTSARNRWLRTLVDRDRYRRPRSAS